eukprot:TRINITY_DN22758_c0_g1_i1.p2 TRINITY_DN22758_c0_g1~~TRINITY_DN22758_c0_g1_i1.p2  ORF type:complete len:171 (+),score=22.64 TRINITY_DN22758_c0_g1_i1:65-514(+)
MLDLSLLQLVKSSILSGALQFTAGAVMMLVFSSWGHRVFNELNHNAAFRPQSDFRMGVYVPFLCPFVNAFLLGLMFQHVLVNIPLTASLPAWQSGAVVSFLLWLTNTAHGIVIDWCCYRISALLTVWMMLCTLAQSVVNGAVTSWMLSG